MRRNEVASKPKTKKWASLSFENVNPKSGVANRAVPEAKKIAIVNNAGNKNAFNGGFTLSLKM